MHPSTSRRHILHTAAIGGIATLAGCSRFNGSSDDGIPDPAPATYQPFLVAPAEVDSFDTPGLTALDLETMRTQRNNMPQVDAELDSEMDFAPTETVENGYTFNSFLAYTGTFGTDTVTSSLQGMGLQRTESHNGYEVYESSLSRAAAVADGVLILANPESDPVAALRRVIDTYEGDLTRFHEVNEDARTLVETLGGGTAVNVFPSEAGAFVPDASMGGTATIVGSDESALRVVLLFESESAVDTDTVRETVAGTTFFHTEADISIGTDGRTVVAYGTTPTQELQSLLPDSDSDTAGDHPDINATMDYRGSGTGPGELVVTHNGGEAIPTAQLAIRGSGFADVAGVDATGPGPWTGSASGTVDGEPAVVAGDSMTVGVSPDYDVRLVVGDGEGGYETVVASSGPEAE